MFTLQEKDNRFECRISIAALNQMSEKDIDTALQRINKIPYLLMELTDEQNVSELNFDKILYCAGKMEKMGGIMVLVLRNYNSTEASFTPVIVPSYQEAVDYIFMEKLEREMFGDHGE